MSGPLIVVCNHMTFAEPPLIRIYLGRESKFAAKPGFFKNKIIGAAMRSFGAFPVYPGRSNAKTIRMIERYLAEGTAVGIFPEGTRSPTARMIPANPGAALIAERTGAPILPVGISGTEKMRGKRWYVKRPQLIIRFGVPFYLPPGSGKLERDDSTSFIMEHIAELIPQEYHGVYSKRDLT